MRVLIVGAGSVGLVYGWHLQQGGAEVHFFVKEKYAAEAREGFVLYPPRAKAPVRFKAAGVVTTAAEVAASRWDQVWLCIASPALRGDWLGALVAAMGEAVLVSMLPGMRDREILARLVPPERFVAGMIAFSSWHAPLGAEPLPEPGMAWWHPPMSASAFEGPAAAVEPLVAALRKGGCPAATGNTAAQSARGSGFLLTAVAAMECAGWTLAGLREARWASLAAAAGKEALVVACAHEGISTGPMGMVLSPMFVRLATRIVPMVAPMDFEAFLRVHFSKVGEQTLMALDAWIAEGRKRNLPVDALTNLAGELRRTRGLQ